MDVSRPLPEVWHVHLATLVEVAGVKWERDTIAGVYKRPGARGRTLFRHVYRDAEGKQIACSKHRNITETRAHQREMLVTKPPPATRATLRETYEQRVLDAEYAPATLKAHEAAWRHIRVLEHVQVGKITPKQAASRDRIRSWPRDAYQGAPPALKPRSSGPVRT